VFPNRIENGFHKQAAAAALTFCYAVGLCGWISALVPNASSSRLPPGTISKTCGGVTLHFHPAVEARGFCVRRYEHQSVHTTTARQKTAATTRLHLTLGGLPIGLTSLGIWS